MKKLLEQLEDKYTLPELLDALDTSFEDLMDTTLWEYLKENEDELRQLNGD